MDIRTVQTHCPAAQAFRANAKCWSSEKYLLHIYEAKAKKHHLAQLLSSRSWVVYGNPSPLGGQHLRVSQTRDAVILL